MDDCFGVERLVELMFAKRFKITPEMTEPGYPFACLLVNDFPKILHQVLFARSVILGRKWSNTFDSYTSDMLPTQESYLNNLIFACYKEQYCQQHTFDKFINLCSFVGFFRYETLNKKGWDFSYLNSAVVLELYEHSLKKSFLKCGGLPRLLAYIREHKYLSWNWMIKDTVDLQDPSIRCDRITLKNIEKEITTEILTSNSVKQNVSVIKENTRFITQKILLSISCDLPTLVSIQDSNRTTWLQDEEKTAEEKRQIQADLKPLEDSSNSGSKTIPEANEKAWCEVTVQAVMRHNHAKVSDLGPTNSFVLKQAEEILEHLKDSIKSLISVLDEYAEEQMI